MQNIGGENAGDAFYRYKMPRLVAKVRVLCLCASSLCVLLLCTYARSIGALRVVELRVCARLPAGAARISVPLDPNLGLVPKRP